MNGNTIESACLNINELFTCFYRVPNYQRGYVWRKKNIEQFLNDVYSPFEDANFEGEDADEYFIGSIVLCPTKGKIYDVIDGQQRLTTIQLLLCFIRNRLKELNNDVPQDLTGLLANSYTDFSGNTANRRRLILEYSKGESILTKILDEKTLHNTTDSTAVKNIQDAFEQIGEFLKQKFDSKPERYKKFYGYFINRVKLVKISTENVSSALMLFETINQRGVGLNSFDLIKNKLFMEANKSLFSEITERWEELQETIFRMQEKPLRFMRYFIISHYKLTANFNTLSEKNVFEWFEKNSNQLILDSDPRKFLSTIIKAVNNYEAFFTRNEDNLGKDNDFIRNIKLLGGGAARQHLIVLLAASSLDRIDFNRVAEQLEKCMFVSLMVKERSQAVEGSYHQWAAEIRDWKNDTDINCSLNSLLKKMADDRENKKESFGEHFRNLETSQIQKYRMKYILAKLCQSVEIEAFGREDATTNLNNYLDGYEIEHIYPQNPSEKAMEEFGDSTLENIEQRIGNLTLLEKSINASASNLPYSEKGARYSESRLLLTKNIHKRTSVGINTKIDKAAAKLRQYSTWNEENLKDRQELLYDLAKKIWIN